MSKNSTRGFVYLILILFIVAPWTSSLVAASACDAPRDTTAVTGIFVEPDDGYRPLIDEFDEATCTIDLSIYLLSDPVIIEALVAAQVRGVTVRVQIEEHPFGGSYESTGQTIAVLDNAGIDWRYTPDHFRFSHAKYAVVDRSVGIVMNLNLTPSAFYDNREFGAITTDRAIVSDLNAVFDADWDGLEQDLGASSVMISPDNGRDVLMSTIAQADRTIEMYAEVVRDEEVVSAIIAATGRGVTVRLIVNPSLDDLDFSVYANLISGGVEVRSAPHLYIHAKTLIMDDALVIVGSHNPTPTSLDENREISLIVADPDGVDRVARTFAGDWIRTEPIFP